MQGEREFQSSVLAQYNANQDQGVKTVATLEADLSDVPDSEFKLRRSPDGRPYHYLGFEIQITIQNSLEFSLSVRGEKYGSVTARYL